MPPPYRRNPIADARAALLEEQPEPRYFPRYGSGGAFDPQAELGLQAADTMARDDLFTYRDDASTKAAENIYRRLSSASRSKILPFSEAATIAKERLASASDTAALPDVPIMQNYAREKALTEADKERLTRQELPEDSQYRSARRAAEMENIQTNDPYATRLQRIHGATPSDIASYQQFTEIAPPDLTPRKRQEWAHGQTLALMKDKEVVDAADFLANEEDPKTGKVRNPEALGIIETVTDPAGRLIGHRIKPGADPQKVSEMVMTYRRHQKRRADDAEQRRQYTLESTTYNQQQDNLSQQIKELSRDYEVASKDTKAMIAKEIEALRAQRSNIGREWTELRKRHFPAMKEGDAPSAEPAKEEASKEAPKGPGANVADFYKATR